VVSKAPNVAGTKVSIGTRHGRVSLDLHFALEKGRLSVHNPAYATPYDERSMRYRGPTRSTARGFLRVAWKPLLASAMGGK
jgi:hypothetical protein